MSSTEYTQCRCLNPNHKKQVEALLHKPVHDTNTMQAYHVHDSNKVYLYCPWCGYKAEVDLTIRPLILNQHTKQFTINRIGTFKSPFANFK